MMLYLWVKVVHLFFVISWMVSLLYLPRIFVYHAQAAPGSEKSETFKIMEGRLLRIISYPAFIVSWISGLMLGYMGGFLKAGWFHMTFSLGILLSVYHLFLYFRFKDFFNDKNRYSPKFYRMINEVPSVTMIAILICVTLKFF